MTIHENTMQGLREALAYAKGDKTKGRSFLIELPDAEIEQAQMPWRKILSLPDENRNRLWVNRLITSSS